MTVDATMEGALLAGRYRLERRIGGGGASEVFRAHDRRLDRDVAVKMFRLNLDENARRRFSAEARLLAALSHPALIEVYDVGEHQGHEFLVLRLVRGDTLARGIAAGPLPPARVAAIGMLLAGALAHVHQRGIVHRDVKPSNILCAAGEVFLADFGISRLIGSDPLTGVGVVVGTASYLAPEQVRGQQVGPPADVYALGLVLLECLTARVEYPGPLFESAVARLHRRPSVPDDVPPALADVIAVMTALDPEQRPSAAECATALLAARAAILSPTAAADGAAEPTSPPADPGDPDDPDDPDEKPWWARVGSAPFDTTHGTADRRALPDTPTVEMAAIGSDRAIGAAAGPTRRHRAGPRALSGSRHRVGRRRRWAAAGVAAVAASVLGAATLAGIDNDPEAAATNRQPGAAAPPSASAPTADSAPDGAESLTLVANTVSTVTPRQPPTRTTVEPSAPTAHNRNTSKNKTVNTTTASPRTRDTKTTTTEAATSKTARSNPANSNTAKNKRRKPDDR